MKAIIVSVILFLSVLYSNAQEYVYSDYSEEYSVEATFISAFLNYTEDGNSYWTLKFTANDGSEAIIENYYEDFLFYTIEEGTPVNIGKKFSVTLINVVDYYDDGSEDYYYFGVACTLK